jgi:DNA-directed RNA polymerase subunit M/transcription elongation factor TFIIS
MSSKLQFCPNCDNYLYLDGKCLKKSNLLRTCRTCGYEKEDTEGLVMETDLREKSSEGYKVIMNEFTRYDPTLPHIHNIKCPNGECPSNTGGGSVAGAGGASGAGGAGAGGAGAGGTETKPVINSDIIYLKFDPENMKYAYICNNCGVTWKSK